MTNSGGESEAEEEELPLYKDTAFLQEEVEEEDLPLEQDENQETEGSLWDFKAPPRLAKEEKRPEVGTGNKAEPILSPAAEALLQEAFAKMEAIQKEEKANSEDAESNKSAAGLSEEQERLALAMLSAMLPEEEAAPLEETPQSGGKIDTAQVDGKEVSVKSWSFPKDEK